MRIDFSDQPTVYSLGRNGEMKTVGLVASIIDFATDPARHSCMLSPINSKGVEGRCFIEVPLTALPELIEGLQEALANYKAARMLESIL